MITRFCLVDISHLGASYIVYICSTWYLAIGNWSTLCLLKPIIHVTTHHMVAGGPHCHFINKYLSSILKQGWNYSSTPNSTNPH